MYINISFFSTIFGINLYIDGIFLSSIIYFIVVNKMEGNNPTLTRAHDYLKEHTIPYFLRKYLHPTKTVAQKREMLATQFKDLGPLTVVQGSLLQYGGKQSVYFLYVHHKRINFKNLKKELGIPKKDDVTFFSGDLEAITGSQEGEIPPFLPNLGQIAFIAFSGSLLTEAKGNPQRRYEFAISKDEGIIVNAYALFQAPQNTLGKKLKEVE